MILLVSVAFHHRRWYTYISEETRGSKGGMILREICANNVYQPATTPLRGRIASFYFVWFYDPVPSSSAGPKISLACKFRVAPPALLYSLKGSVF